jgi:hypothetical protein
MNISHLLCRRGCVLHRERSNDFNFRISILPLPKTFGHAGQQTKTTKLGPATVHVDGWTPQIWLVSIQLRHIPMQGAGRAS